MHPAVNDHILIFIVWFNFKFRLTSFKNTISITNYKCTNLLHLLRMIQKENIQCSSRSRNLTDFSLRDVMFCFCFVKLVPYFYIIAVFLNVR